MILRIVLVAFVFGLVTLASDSPPPGACKLNDQSFNTEEGGCLHFRSGLVWTLSPKKKRSYADALQYCENLEEASLNDWRLPTLEELTHVAQNRAALEHFEFSVLDLFWAAVKGNGEDAWLVELGSGDKDQAEKASSTGRAICVRNPPDIDEDGVPDSSDRCNLTSNERAKKREVWTVGEYKGCAGGDDFIAPEEARKRINKRQRMGCREESNDFRTGTGGCVDLSTGLEWSAVSDEPIWRILADRYCSSLEEGITQNFKGWRLPTADELLKVAGEVLAGKYFKGPVNQHFWSSTIRSREINGNIPQVAPFFGNYYATGNALPQSTVNLYSREVEQIDTQKLPPYCDPMQGITVGNYNVPTNQKVVKSVICVKKAQSAPLPNHAKPARNIREK